MKKIIFGLALLLSAQAGHAQSGKLKIAGDLKGFTDSVVVVTPNGDKYDFDTVTVANGKFSAEITLAKPATVIIATPATLRRQDRKLIQFIGVPDETVSLVGDLSSRYDIDGSKFYKQYHEADIMMEDARKPMMDWAEALSAKMTDANADSIRKIYADELPAYEKKYTDAILNFIKQHPDYEASAAIITNLGDVKMMDEAVASLSESVKNGRMKEYYEAPIRALKAQQEAEEKAQKVQAAGQVAPDFTLTDINGQKLSLSDFKGKYVLLDFWGSWCIWCIKGFPQMKEYYNKYKGKYEILGIDCNDTQEKWKEAVAKYELPWKHVYNDKDSKVLSDYAIQGFPTKILVGPDGKIVKTIVGEDPAFYTFLDETFGK